MTLSPVFRSPQAVRMLQQNGILDRFAPNMARQAEAVRTVQRDLAAVIGPRFRSETEGDITRRGDGVDAHGRTHAGAGPEAELEMAAALLRGGDAQLTMLQDYFFLIVFMGVFESMGIAPERLPFYAEMDFCIKGTITSADNLFDDQAKSLLPLKTEGGAKYASIMELMCFERLMQRVGGRGIAAGHFTRAQFDATLHGLMDLLAEIGALEGSEEDGVDEIPEPEAMIDRVHRVRGGLLFGLAFVAPRCVEKGDVLERIKKADPAVARLGTAFQIVDDLTDFEFDIGRRSHNLLVSWIHHRGSDEARAKLAELREGGRDVVVPTELVNGLFAECARSVLERAYEEARAGFEALEELGFWFPASLSEQVVQAIVGLEGVARMESLAAPQAVAPAPGIA